MALIDCGQSYTITSDNFSVPNTPASYDLLQISTGSTVPVFISRILLNANATAAAIQRITALRRSTASTGGSSLTPNPLSAGSSAASCTVLLLPTTTTGTAGAQIDNQQWNEFAPYQFDLTPRGVLIPAASWYSLFVPANPAAAFNASITIEMVEIK